MEVISLKLDENMLANVDKTLKMHNFSTRTEFIRDAIRDKLDDLHKESLMKEFLSYQGSAKKKVSDADLRKIRDEVYEKLKSAR